MTDTTDQQRTEALARYGQRVTELCEALYAIEDPDATATYRVPEAIQKEAAFLVEEGPAAYLHYVEKLDDAAVRADLDRHLDEVLGEQEATDLPIVLSGGVHRCGRCLLSFSTQTYHVIHDLGTRDGHWRYADICRGCATADPALSHWQRLCDVADVIDSLMQVAPDKRTRNLFAAQLKGTADHFARWRWPEDDDER
ncbi:hypothetical protein [Actinoallomurus sp. CA-142502]|uniref:hypothetical protein n=1 Tax=Actinoallomurus sp. CA-142502 TaxID=3239885 RepID=UPI003D8D36F6